MLSICLFTFIWLAFGYYIYPSVSANKSKTLKKKNNSDGLFAVVVFISVLVRIISASFYHGHETDMNCFNGWSSLIYSAGPSGFYTSPSFTDYPPGYMYILYIIGWIKDVFNVTQMPVLLLKTPAIICDILIGIIIYRAALKELSGTASTLISMLWMINPAAIVDSSFWGQVDSVYTLFTVIYVLMLYKRKIIPSIFVFALCIFIKPQSIMLTPLLLLAVFEQYIYPKFDLKNLLRIVGFGLVAILMILILSIPFGLKEVIAQYTSTIGSYPHATVNAFNIWGLLGQNWSALNIFSNTVGYLSIVVICIICALVFLRIKTQDKYFYLGAFLIFGTFTLSTHMHERYAFAAMPLLLLAFVYNRSARDYATYIALTACQFFNYAWVLFIYETDTGTHFKSPVIIAASFVTVLCFITFASAVLKPKKDLNAVHQKKKLTAKSLHQRPIALSKMTGKMDRKDYIIVAIITLIYGITAYTNLGDMKAPTSMYSVNETVRIDLGKDKNVKDVMLFIAPPHIDEYRTVNIVSYNEAGEQITNSSSKSGCYVYDWSPFGINNDVRYIELSTNQAPLNVLELAIKDQDLNDIIPVNADNFPGLFDEQDLVPKYTSFMNSSYFDEIYHARTAKEYIDGTDIYEWTHPPLGKLFISIGIMIFGMNPFGWRFMGTFFGILMISVIYIFIKKIFNKRSIAIFGCLLFTFDFMHFVQSRIATVDVYSTFFIILMYMFIYEYIQKSFYDTKLSKTFIPLALSGVFFGLSVSCKWNSAYAAVGLAIIFFYSLFKRYREYLYAKSKPRASTDGIEHKYIIESFGPNTLKTIGWCLIFFVAVPIIIYIITYIPYMRAEGNYTLSAILENQQSMFTYHSKTVINTTHPYSSKWYEWLIMKRPVWFYSATYPDGLKGGISTFGNPALWWGGLVALILNIYYAATQRDKLSGFLLIAYISQLIFWIPIERTTYIYHYFPMVPFICLMMCNCMNHSLKETKGKYVWAWLIYAGFAVVLFIMFYPVLTGVPVSSEYVTTYLKWLETWQLVG